MQSIERTNPEHLSRVSTKGQVTIPAEIRRLLGLGPHDTVAFTVEDHQVKLKRSQGVVQRTAGALAGPGPKLSAEEERAAAEQAIAEEATRRMDR